jgi:hypothetical protein
VHLVLHDAPPTGVDAVWVSFDEVSVRSAAGDWHVVSTQAQSVDLMTLQNGVVADLGLATLPAGDYDQIRLHLSGSWVIVKGAMQALDVPSGTQSGLKIDSAFTVPPCGEVTLSLDWNLGAHLIDNPGHGYILRPVLQVDSMTTVKSCGQPGRWVRLMFTDYDYTYGASAVLTEIQMRWDGAVQTLGSATFDYHGIYEDYGTHVLNNGLLSRFDGYTYMGNNDPYVDIDLGQSRNIESVLLTQSGFRGPDGLEWTIAAFSVSTSADGATYDVVKTFSGLPRSSWTPEVPREFSLIQ